MISGTVYYPTSYPSIFPSSKPVAGATVVLAGDALQTTQTAADGTYSFTVNAGSNFTVTPNIANTNVPANGVTTLDISLIRRHILDISHLDSPYKLLAADVNASQSVTTLDISYIRKLVIDSASAFPAGLWRLVPADYIFPDPANPWDPPPNRSYTNLLADIFGQDFLAIKLGDVNASWSPPAGLSTPGSR